MGPWLLMAGVVVIAVGLVALFATTGGAADADSRTAHRHERGDEHGHAHGIGVGWLLLAPIAALLLGGAADTRQLRGRPGRRGRHPRR